MKVYLLLVKVKIYKYKEGIMSKVAEAKRILDFADLRAFLWIS